MACRRQPASRSCMELQCDYTKLKGRPRQQPRLSELVLYFNATSPPPPSRKKILLLLNCTNCRQSNFGAKMFPVPFLIFLRDGLTLQMMAYNLS
ncbi:hypothetical protein ISCGN_027856 [Ixodes scapularis]